MLASLMCRGAFSARLVILLVQGASAASAGTRLGIARERRACAMLSRSSSAAARRWRRRPRSEGWQVLGQSISYP